MSKITFTNAKHLRDALNYAVAQGQDRQLLDGMRRLLEVCASYCESDPKSRHAVISPSVSCIGESQRNAVSFDFLVFEAKSEDDPAFLKHVLNGGLIYHPHERDWSIHT